MIFFEKKNPKTNTGITPLHLAAKNGHLDIYEFLSKHVVDMNPTMDSDITPLHLAAKYGHLEVCQFICKNLDGWNNLLHWNHRFIGIYRSDAITAVDLAFMRGHIRTASFIRPYIMVLTYWYIIL